MGIPGNLRDSRENLRDSRDPKIPLGIPGNFWIFVKFCREFDRIVNFKQKGHKI